MEGQMFRRVVFYDNLTDGLTSTWSSFLLQGVLLVVLGILILILPELLAAMVAATFIILGSSLVFIALKTKNLRKSYRSWRDEFWEPTI
jgi:uncharacterized membrane protein HdeD (DUF308 family)